MPNPVPFSYEFMNEHYGRQMNSFLHISRSGVARYFKRYLMQEVLSVFDFTIPDNWDSDYFRYILFGWGYIAILKTDKFGVIPQQCGLSGQNVFYRPVKCTIANPLISPVELTINRDCALVKLMPDYGNISDLVDNYGNMLALAYETASINILNSRLSYVFNCADKNASDTNKALFDEIASGKPAVFKRSARDSVPGQPDWDVFSQNVGQNFITPEILDSMEKIRDMFLTDIGIPNLSTRKKERVSIDEAEKNSVETMCKAKLWLEEMQDGIEKATEIFPELKGKLSVKLRFGGEYANVDEDDSQRSVRI